jgi:peptidoglycan/LPS O-acetylase OafA/YrhL
MGRRAALLLPGEPGSDSPNLDLLRASAVLLVFFAHVLTFHGLVFLGPLNLEGVGILGVLIFFVHTCLVLMMSLERQWNRQGSANFFIGFIIRRCFRILPLSMLVVALVALFRLPLGHVEPHNFVGERLNPQIVLFNLLLIQNLPKMKVSILGPLWSLPFEMQMYLFLPSLFLLVRSTRSVWRIALVCALSIGLAILALLHPGIPLLVRFIPCFLPGVIAYQVQRKKISQLPAFLWPLLITILTVLYTAGYTEPSWWRRWTACLILGLAVPRFAQISSRWLVATCHVVAKYSYGIYLTHFFTIWFALQRLSHAPRIDRLFVLIVLSTGLPVVFYHGIEEPMIRLGKTLADRSRPLRLVKASS